MIVSTIYLSEKQEDTLIQVCWPTQVRCLNRFEIICMLTFVGFEMTAQVVYNISQGFVSTFLCFLRRIETDILQVFNIDLLREEIIYWLT